MKLHRLFVSALAVLALTVPAMADDTPLSEEMEKLSKALKLVNRNLADPSAKDANLKRIEEAQAALEASHKYEPALAKDVPAAEKAKFMEDYKAAMQETKKTLEELKTAVAASNTEAAAKVMEKLNTQKKEGHKKFQAEE